MKFGFECCRACRGVITDIYHAYTQKSIIKIWCLSYGASRFQTIAERAVVVSLRAEEAELRAKVRAIANQIKQLHKETGRHSY
jgi:uncharacterized heparinase superfamily protein